MKRLMIHALVLLATGCASTEKAACLSTANFMTESQSKFFAVDDEEPGK